MQSQTRYGWKSEFCQRGRLNGHGRSRPFQRDRGRHQQHPRHQVGNQNPSCPRSKHSPLLMGQMKSQRAHWLDVRYCGVDSPSHQDCDDGTRTGHRDPVPSLGYRGQCPMVYRNGMFQPKRHLLKWPTRSYPFHRGLPDGPWGLTYSINRAINSSFFPDTGLPAALRSSFNSATFSEA